MLVSAMCLFLLALIVSAEAVPIRREGTAPSGRELPNLDEEDVQGLDLTLLFNNLLPTQDHPVPLKPHDELDEVVPPPVVNKHLPQTPSNPSTDTDQESYFSEELTIEDSRDQQTLPTRREQPESTTATSTSGDTPSENPTPPKFHSTKNKTVKYNEIHAQNISTASVNKLSSTTIEVKSEKVLKPTKSYTRFVEVNPYSTSKTPAVKYTTPRSNRLATNGGSKRVPTNTPRTEQSTANGRRKFVQASTPLIEQSPTSVGSERVQTNTPSIEKSTTNDGSKRVETNTPSIEQPTTNSGNKRIQTNKPNERSRRQRSTTQSSVTKSGSHETAEDPTPAPKAQSVNRGTKTGSRRSPTNAMTHSSILRKNLKSNPSLPSVKWTNTVRHRPTQPYRQPVFIYTQPTTRHRSKKTTTAKSSFYDSTDYPTTDEVGVDTSTLSSVSNVKTQSNFHAKPFFQISKTKFKQINTEEHHPQHPGSTTETITIPTLLSSKMTQKNDVTQTLRMKLPPSSTTERPRTTAKLVKMPTSRPVTRAPPYRRVQMTQTPNYLIIKEFNSEISDAQSLVSVKPLTMLSKLTSAQKHPHKIANTVHNRPAISHVKITEKRPATRIPPTEDKRSAQASPNSKIKKASANKTKHYATSYVIPNNTLRATH